uniref:Recep_L_domain domain-containing protein n=1 Tax=Steinernema glaseri TaxID=37863 RepID=A0A1I7YHZ1_9BILA
MFAVGFLVFARGLWRVEHAVGAGLARKDTDEEHKASSSMPTWPRGAEKSKDKWTRPLITLVNSGILELSDFNNEMRLMINGFIVEGSRREKHEYLGWMRCLEGQALIGENTGIAHPGHLREYVLMISGVIDGCVALLILLW